MGKRPGPAKGVWRPGQLFNVNFSQPMVEQLQAYQVKVKVKVKVGAKLNRFRCADWEEHQAPWHLTARTAGKQPRREGGREDGN